MSGRLARTADGTTGISFRQDPTSLAQIDKAIATVRAAGLKTAA